MSEHADLMVLAQYPPGEWVAFKGDDGELLNWVDGDLPMARFNGLVESAVAKPKGIMGPIYHRLTDKGRAFVEAKQPDSQPTQRVEG